MAEDVDCAVSRKFAEASAQLPKRNMERAGAALDGDFSRFAHIEKKAGLGAIPVDEGHVAAHRVGGHHSSEVHGIFGASELRRIAQLGFFEVVNGRAHLQGHRQCADALVDIVLAESLRPKEAPVRFPVQYLHRDGLRAGIITGMRSRIDIDFLVIAIAKAL